MSVNMELTLVNLLLLPLFCTTNFLDEAFIEKINKQQTFWKAGKNFPDSITEKFIEGLTGTESPFDIVVHKNETKIHVDAKADFLKIGKAIVPDTFDARERWPSCKVMDDVPDQGQCGSSWAIATAAALSDRLCVATKGKRQYQLSADDLLSCCDFCAKTKRGCYKGHVEDAFRFFFQYGLVSGGHYRTDEGCKPFPSKFYDDKMDYLKCSQECSNHKYKVSYSDDKTKIGFKLFIYLQPNIKHIMQEIMRYGPIVAVFQVHNDFLTYKNGVYVNQIKDKNAPWHTVNIFGWGKENQQLYWLARNSWGSKWGDLGGFFKIRRGVNEANIESAFYSYVFYSLTIKPTEVYLGHEKTASATSPIALKISYFIIFVTCSNVI